MSVLPVSPRTCTAGWRKLSPDLSVPGRATLSTLLELVASTSGRTIEISPWGPRSGRRSQA